MTIKAIETVYKGYKFRSRLEARWAVFFDALGIEWQYEVEGFDLGELGWYLPDFYLPNWHCWIEIKPNSPSIRHILKALKVRHHFIEKDLESGDAKDKKHVKTHFYIFYGVPGLPKIEYNLYDQTWILKDGSIGINPLAGIRETNPEPLNIADNVNVIPFKVASVKDIENGNIEIGCHIETFAMTGGGDSLDIWPVYLEEIAPEFAPPAVQFFVEKYGFEKVFLVPAFPEGFAWRAYKGDGVFYDSPNLLNAYSAARQARFEQGQNGA